MSENKKTVEANADAIKNANEKGDKAANASAPTPVMKASSEDVSFDAPSKKNLDKYEKFASNDGEFVLSKLDDQTSVSEGNVMENQAREPAHQQHELAVEEDAPGFEQSGSLYTARGNVHYREGGSVAEVAAGRSYGQA